MHVVSTVSYRQQASLTKSSWISLNALAMITTANGTIVVYLPVGDTPGTCWMQAVKRKNRLADLENSAGSSAGKLHRYNTP
jgi:hypothetical protein